MCLRVTIFYSGEHIERTFDVTTGTCFYLPAHESVYKKGDLIFSSVDLMYKKGETVCRKFVIIR